ncbi:serine protease, partial [Blyttiomyces sp. JEL0837]
MMCQNHNRSDVLKRKPPSRRVFSKSSIIATLALSILATTSSSSHGVHASTSLFKSLKSSNQQQQNAQKNGVKSSLFSVNYKGSSSSLGEDTPGSFGSFASTTSKNSGDPSVSPSDSHIIPDHYIVSLYNDVSTERIASHHSLVTSLLSDFHLSPDLNPLNESYLGITHTYYDSGWAGYAVHIPTSIHSYISNHPSVEYIEPDIKIFSKGFLVSQSVNVNVGQKSSNATVGVEEGAPWGLDRIGHRSSGSLGVYTYKENGG